MDLHLKKPIQTKSIPSDSETSSSKKQSIGAERDVVGRDLEGTQNSSSAIVRAPIHRTVETDRSRAAPPPAQKLPPEIVAKIFVHCISEPVGLPCYRYDPPLLLCQICSAWRQLALGTSQLWSSISLCPDAQQISSGGLLDLAKSWISRSSCSPLTIHYSIDHNLSPLFEYLNLNSIPDFIAPVSNRLRELSLYLPVRFFTPLWLLPPNSMELLETLHLAVISNIMGEEGQFSSDWTIPADANAFNYAPRLHRATFASMNLIVNVEAMRLPWHQLTSLDFIKTFISPDACHSVLRHCTKLVSCTMGLALSQNTLTHASTILLPNLKIFQLHLEHVNFDEIIEIGIFLEPLVFPILEDFKVDSRKLINWSHSAFTFLTSLSSLKRLAIASYIIFEGRELVPSLQNMPFLERLELSHANNLADGHIIDMLRRRDFLPKLEVAELYIYDYAATYGYGIVAEMLESRWRPQDPNHPASKMMGTSVSRLKHVFLVVSDEGDIDVESRKRLHDLIREGMNLGYISLYDWCFYPSRLRSQRLWILHHEI